MTKKKLASAKGLWSLVIILAYAAFCAFFFTYGKSATLKFAAEMGEKQSFGGLGPALASVFAEIGLIAFAIPIILFLVSAIGNLVKKGEKLVAFTVVNLVSECIGVVLLFCITACFIDATGYDVFSILVMAAFDLAVLASLAHSIYVLAVAKKAN